MAAARPTLDYVLGPPMSTRHPAVIASAAVAGIALIVLAVVYWVEPAGSLPVVDPRPRGALRPPPRQARHRRAARRARAARLRLVPDGEEGQRPARHVILDAPITYFQAIVLGLLQGVTELFPISSLGHSVILPRLLRLGHPPERRLLHHVPRRDSPRDGDRAAALLPARLGADRQGARPQPARPRDRRGRRGREARVAADRRHDPGRASSGCALEHALREPVRVGAVGRVLPDGERAAADRRRGATPPRAPDGRGRRHADRAPGSLPARSSSAPPRRWR